MSTAKPSWNSPDADKRPDKVVPSAQDERIPAGSRPSVNPDTGKRLPDAA